MNINGGMYNILNDYTADGRKLSSRHASCPPNGRGGYYRIHSGTAFYGKFQTFYAI